MVRSPSPFFLALILALFLGASACARKSTAPAIPFEACGLSESEQGLSFLPPMPVRPARLIIDPRFSNDERLEVERAVDQWNSFFGGRFGYPIFSAVVSSLPTYALSGDPRNCESLPSNPEEIPLVKEESTTRWNSLGMDHSVPAATFRCYQEERLVQQSIFIFKPVIDLRQLMSVTVHELGHGVGLDHSCNLGGGIWGYVSCTGLSSDHVYRNAVMYPALRLFGGMGMPETREKLNENDRARAYCRYLGL